METRRYETLDALRGVAAIAVTLFHLDMVNFEAGLVRHGYLAVDFFFVLSGFVVAYAYEDLLLTTLSFRAFIVRRIIRLYPLALLGAMVGFGLLLLKWWFYPSKVDPLPQILLSGLFNGLMLPTFFGGAVSRREIFPGNGALWTLFSEIVANVLWAWVGIRMRTAALLAFAGLSWLALVGCAFYTHSSNIGFDINTFGVGLVRVGFGFPLGVVLYRLRSVLAVPAWKRGPFFLGLALVVVLASPVNADETGLPWWDLANVLLVLPVIVMLGVGQGSAGRLGNWLGQLSYPLYVLHLPLLLVASGLYQTVFRGVNVHVMAAASVLVIVGLATAAMYLYDAPVRRLLSRAAHRRGLVQPRHDGVLHRQTLNSGRQPSA